MLPIIASALFQGYSLPAKPIIIKHTTERAVFVQNKQVPNSVTVEVPGVFNVLGNTSQACASKFPGTYYADWLGWTETISRTGVDSKGRNLEGSMAEISCFSGYSTDQNGNTVGTGFLGKVELPLGWEKSATACEQYAFSPAVLQAGTFAGKNYEINFEPIDGGRKMKCEFIFKNVPVPKNNKQFIKGQILNLGLTSANFPKA